MTTADRPVVLIIEDNPLITMMVRDALTDAGIATVEASSIYEAVSLSECYYRFAAALLDVRVADSLIFPLARTLIRGGIPCVFVTGYDRERMPAEFAHVPYVQKPFRINDLVSTVEGIIAARRVPPAVAA